MRNRAVGALLKGVRTLLDVGSFTGVSDGQLLERFLLRRDDTAEVAFAALVERHGPMVLRTCRCVLQDVHAAEDAFQATFLILARKAPSIRQGDSVANWLFGVARRVAVRADAQRRIRAAHERQAGALAGAEAGSSDRPPEPMHEVQAEVDRLPERYRAPIVLCYLEGLTHEEAAIRLRLPASTVRVRLMRARARLRDRLTRRGLAPAALAGLSAGRALAAIPAPLVDETIRAAIRVAVGRAAGVSAPVAALVEGVIRTMFLAKLKMAAVLLAALMLVSTLMISTLAGPPRPEQDPGVAKDRAAAPAATEKRQPNGEGPEYIVATVKRSRWQRTTNQIGRIVAYGSVDVYARTSGYLKHVNVAIGDHVKHGDVLAEVYDPELAIAADKARAEVGRAKTRLAKAQAAMRVSRAAMAVETARVLAAAQALGEAEAKAQIPKKELDRTRNFAAKGGVSQEEVDHMADRYASAQAGTATARSQLDVARATELEARAKVEAARADVDEAKNEIQIAETGVHSAQILEGYARITAPFDGIVTRRNYHEGAFVRSADAGNVEPIVTVVRSDIMVVVVDVPHNDVPDLDVGDPVTVRLDALKAHGVFEGRITRTAYALDPKYGTLRAEIVLPNTDGRLRPGLVGGVQIELGTRENVLLIPRSAIIGQDEDGTPVCYRVANGRAVETRIKLGLGDGRRVEVLDGLKEGDIVIANPNAGMTDGQTVTIRREGTDRRPID